MVCGQNKLIMRGENCMGEKNMQTKGYVSQNDRFADLCNYLLFEGKNVVRASELKEKDVSELALIYGENDSVAIEKIRDVIKNCVVKSAEGVTYLIVGVENQSDIHYAMVVRNMLYDALNYAAQVSTVAKRHREKRDLRGDEFLSGFSKNDKVIPVVTITVYWSANVWDGPRSLYEMMDVKHPEILDYVSDYKLNLIVPREIEDFARFHTELGKVMEFLRCANEKNELKNMLLKNEEQGIFLSKDAVELLNACVGAELTLPEKEGEGEVCKAIKEMVEEGREEGREEGVRNLIRFAKRSGIPQAEVLESLVEDYNFSVEQAREYIQKCWNEKNV